MDVTSLRRELRRLSADRLDRLCISGHLQNVLISFLDQGGIGWSVQYWLYCSADVEGWWGCDPSHRRNESTDNGDGAVGIKFCKHEATAIRNIPHTVGRRRHFDKHSNMFTCVLPWLCCVGWPGVTILGYGTKLHIQLVFHMCQECRSLQRVGTRSQTESLVPVATRPE